MDNRRLPVIDIDNSFVDKLTALYFSLCFLIAAPFFGEFLGERGELWSGFIRILSSPSPLITDYFALGGFSSSFLNAGLCGLCCTMMMFLLRAKCNYSTYAGFFLVVGHCFYGLNLLNMWPPIIGVWIFCRIRRVDFSRHLSVAFYSTAFGPFFSELIFRYPLTAWSTFPFRSIVALVLLSLFLGYSIPLMLNGAKLLHREMSLYNGGLAFGLLGMLIYSFMYSIMGVENEGSVVSRSLEYLGKENSAFVSCNVFFLLVFLLSLFIGWYLNGGSFAGYTRLLKDPGFKSDFLAKYGDGVTLINLALYGLMMTLYFDLVILFTDGVGWTGATCGIVLASVTFSASGQHPGNVWPVLTGYVGLYALIKGLSIALGIPMVWSLSTQAYMNGAAFATGLCPFTGKYGKRYGFLAGFVSATLATATLSIHGGFMLYNGGLVAGMAALILTPLLKGIKERADETEEEEEM